MDFLVLIARIFFAWLFIRSGVNHFRRLEAMTPYAQSKGIPAAKFMVAISGIMILLGGLSVAFGIFVRIGAWLLILFLIPTAFLMHNFWKEADPRAKSGQQAHFYKNMALAGAAYLIWYSGPGPFSLMPY